MSASEVAVVAGFVFAYALVSRRLQTTWVTGPMVFVAAGIILGEAGVGALDFGMDEGPVRLLAEATLLLLLFTDAIRIDLRVLRREPTLPVRLLLVGLPLAVAAGTFLAYVVLPGWGIWEAAVVAAVLSPTDAALGQAVVADRRVPVRIRQALNVESGLNDGLMVPVVTILVAVAAVGSDLESPGFWAEFVARQLGFGVLAGVVVGYLGGRLLDAFSQRGWVDGAFRQLATLGIGVGAFVVAELLKGNGFVAAFVAGLAFGHAAREQCAGSYDFSEDQAQLLALLTFLAFGAVLAGPRLDELTWPVFVFAVLALTVMRIVPVALSLVGVGLHRVTVAYVGWFGPRGLASILFALFLVEEAQLPRTSELFVIVTWTVLLSVLLHGATSVPLTRRYVDRLSAVADATTMAESIMVPELPLRGTSR
jgi:NhaP-type Na+/H+ or K+/H+ antiporter